MRSNTQSDMVKGKSSFIYNGYSDYLENSESELNLYGLKPKSYLLRNAKGLFLPSKGEGWPVVIAEAIGAEIPCVITKKCNFSEIKTMNLGIEVKDHSEEEWVKVIDEVCFNIQLNEEFKNNLSYYKNSFSWAVITDQWINSYRTIINESR